MLGKPPGIILLAAALLTAGAAGIAAFWAALPRTSNTSPLLALFALTWSSAYLAAGLLTWRRSRFAAPAFLAAIGLLLPPLWFIFPGSEVLRFPSFAIIFLVGLVGYRYLNRAYQPVAQ
jgi:hypothetical protein